MWMAAMLLAGQAGAEVWRVGPDRPHDAPSQVAGLVGNGDRVEIDPGEYPGDVAVWRADDLSVVDPAGGAHLRSPGDTDENNAI